VVSDPGIAFELPTVLTLTAGTVLAMWLADLITRRGIGNGIGLIFFSGISGRLPSALATLLERGRTGAISPNVIALSLGFAVAVVAFIVFMESAERRIRVQYRPRLVGRMMFEGEGAYLVLKPNGFGIIPVLFASSFALIPETLANASADRAAWIVALAAYFHHGSPAFLTYYASLILFFAFLYIALLVSPGPGDGVDRLWRRHRRADAGRGNRPACGLGAESAHPDRRGLCRRDLLAARDPGLAIRCAVLFGRQLPPDPRLC